MAEGMRLVHYEIECEPKIIGSTQSLVSHLFIFINTVSSPIIIVFLTRTKTVEAARADGEKIRLIGAAEARAGSCWKVT